MAKSAKGHLIDPLLLHVLPFMLLALHIFMKPSTYDEGEHLHFAYLVGQGLKPYRDFFEHHMPLVWYVFSPIGLFKGFLSKIIFYKSLQSMFVGLNMLILTRVFPEHRNWTSWAFLIFCMATAPFVDYLDLRPEFIGIPFVIYATSFMIRTPGMDIRSAVLIGLLCGIHVFATPRLYPVILMLGLVVILGRYPIRNKAAFVVSGIVALLSLLVFLGFRDVYFYVFKITRSVKPIPFEKLHYSSKLLIGMSVFLPVCLLLQLIRYRRDGLVILCLNILMMSLWLIERLPYPSQSTLIILLVNCVYAFHLFMGSVRGTSARLLFFVTSVVAVAFFAYRFNIYSGLNFFKTEQLYVSMLRNCEGRAVQSRSTGAIIRPLADGAFFHPLFIKDYTFFGYFQDHLLLHNFGAIIEHRKQKSLTYVEAIKPCYIDTYVARILLQEIPGFQSSTKGAFATPFKTGFR